MSTRRRAGTWQDEVARSFSRFFSRSTSQEKEEETVKDSGEEQDRGDRSLSRRFFRSPSQEKKDGSDKTEHGEEQERSHSPSRLFFRKISQESKGGNDNVSPAKGNKEEQDKSRGFSRLFSKTPSQENEEESDGSRGAREEQSRHENNHSSLTVDRHEELSSSTDPEQVTLEPLSSPPLHIISKPEEEKDGEFPHNSKVLDSEKQSRENFFHFIGNLFHFSPKSSLGNTKQGVGVQEPCKEHEDSQVKNNLDKEDLNQERAQDGQSGIEATPERNTAQNEQENLGVSGGESPKDILEHSKESTTDTQKLNGHALDSPAITYGTYRGSRRIRKLLKRQADVDLPIQEKEETPETGSVGDATTDNCLMLHERIKMEPVPDQNCKEEILPSTIHIKRQSKLKPLDQKSKLHNGDNVIRKAKKSKLTNDLDIKAKDTPICSNSIKVDTENRSEIVELQRSNIKENVINVPQLNAKESSEILQRNTEVSSEDLQPTLRESLNILGHLEQNEENSEDHSKESTVSMNLQPTNEAHNTDVEPKTMDFSDTIGHIQPNTDEVLKLPEHIQPIFKESLNFPESLQTHTDDNSKTETDLSPKIAENINILPNSKENIEYCLTEHANTELSKSEKHETFSVIDNLQSKAKDTLLGTEEFEESSKENTKIPVNLERCLDVDMQSSLQKSHMEMILDSGDCLNDQQVAKVDLHVEDKPHKDPSDNLHTTTHNKSARSSDKKCEDVNLPPSDYLKPEIEKMSNIDLQPNSQLVSSSTVDLEPNPRNNSTIVEQLKIHGDEYLKQPDKELDGAFLNKTLPESKDAPNLHPQLNETSRTSEDLQQIENVEHIPPKANIIPENDLQNDEELLKIEPRPNTQKSIQLLELNNSVLEKTLSESEDIRNLNLQVLKTSRTSEDLQQMENVEHLPTNATVIPENDLQNNEELLKTELQPNTKESFQLTESNNTSLEKALSDSEDIPNLHLPLNDKYRTSEDLQQIENVEHLLTNANVIPENDLQNDEELPKIEPQQNTKESFQFIELNNKFVEKTLSQSEEIPNLHLQVNQTSRTSEDPQQVENVEHLPTNTNVIPENNLQNDEELLKIEPQPNTKESFQLEELNNTFVEKTLSQSEDIPNLHVKVDQISRTSEDLQQVENVNHLLTNTNVIPENNLQNGEELPKIEPQSNTKESFQLMELDNKFVKKTLSESEDIPNLDLQLSEVSRTSEDLKQIRNTEHLETIANIIPENDPQKVQELLQPNTKVNFQLKESSDDSPLEMGIISKIIEKQKPNIHVVSKVSDDTEAKLEEPSRVKLCLQPNSNIHVAEVSIDSLVHKVSQRHECMSDEGTSHELADEDVCVDKPNKTVKELNIKHDICYDNPDNMTVPESCLNDISALSKEHETVNSRNVSFDNGIECHSPSASTISDSPSYVDIQFESPNDSGIVSSQAYTPDEHIRFNTFPSEILNKSAPDPLAVDQKSEEASVPKPDSIVNVKSVPILQNKEPMIDVNNGSEEEPLILVDCKSNAASDVSTKMSTPDKIVNLTSDVYVAKVSMKTVNIEEVKISPYGLCSDIISVTKLESPTFTKEVICIPNLSPPPTETKNTFRVVHCDDDPKDFAINRGLPSHKEDYLTVNNSEKHQKNYLETDELPSHRDNDLTINPVSDLPNNDNKDGISLNICIEKESPKIPDKSPQMLLENVKNNNINVCTSDNIINVSLQTHKSERELTNEALMSSDSLKELRLGESLSELNADSKMNHREKLSDLLLHSGLLHDVSDTNEIISSCSTNAKMILPGKDYSESSNELFEQKANQIIFSVLNSAIDELQNINQSHNHMSMNNHTLSDIKHVKQNLSENHIDPKDHPAEVLNKCSGKPSDHVLIEDTDLIVSMAVGIVNDVISSSKQLVVSNNIPNGLSKDITTSKANQQKTPNDFNGLSMDNTNDLSEDATNSNHVGSSLGYDNVVHLSSSEINSNVLQVTTEVSQNIETRQAREPNSLNEVSSRVTEDIRKNDMDRIESNGLSKTAVEEHLSFSRSPVKTDTYNLMNETHTNGDLEMESISLETEGSMEDLMYNDIQEESNSSEFSDFLQFSLYSSRYVELSGSDDESTDEEKDNGSEQDSGNDSFLPVQSRRVRIYPYVLSPIYEDDSACEDILSNNSSPRHNEGAAASNSGHDHTSILSLLQSVSDRLKEADLEEASREERFSSLSSEVSTVNERFYKEGSGEVEHIIPSSKTSTDVPSTQEDEKPALGTRSGLFITKSFAEKPNPVLGRQSFLLNLTSHSNIYGAKSSVESSSVPHRGETSVSPTTEPNPNQSTDLSLSTAAANSLSSELALPIQSSTLDHKPHMSPKSVYYQYFHANYLSNKGDNESPAQEKLDELKETTELDMDTADSDSLKFNPRPGKVILSDILEQDNKIELKADVLDATSWVFPNGVNIRVIRGCWILYEKTHFEGQAHVLEEGEAVLRHLWDPPEANTKPDKITIGSVKRVVKDYLPEVVISSVQDVSDSPIYIRTEVASLENLVGKHPRSLVVNSGVWLAYSEPQYNGTVTVLEEGRELPQVQDSSLKSMRPLKMGGLKVQLPSDPKIIIYEKTHFQGWSREVTEHVCSIGTLTRDGENSGSQDIGSLQVIGGIWVGYENERYKGHQYLLEEGDYEDWHAWGGYNNTLQSVRYLQADFLETSVTLYKTDEDGKQINLFNQAIPDLELAGYSTRTQCIHVKKGMWVAYRQKHFCGEQYILESGRYKTYMDWGGSNNTIKSIRPVLLEPLGRSDAKHLIKAYTRAKFQGEAMDFTQGVSEFTSFIPMSFKVLRGCWLLCYDVDSCDNLCVLEEGHFPDLASCGCPTAEIKYIKPIDYVFAEPSVSLFALDSCEGRELHFEESVTSILSKDLHFDAQSVWVRRGLWIAFEGANFLGRQMLLDPQQILNWSQFSGWKAIGSLRPLKQPSVYFMVKNRDKDKYLSATGKLADSRATFVNVSARNGQTTQIWYFCRGFLKSKANDSCLDVIGGKNIAGSKVSMWAEHGKARQKWKINKDGTVSSYISDDLVLDLKGGNYYDQNYIVVNKVQENAPTQKWDIEIL